MEIVIYLCTHINSYVCIYIQYVYIYEQLSSYHLM